LSANSVVPVRVDVPGTGPGEPTPLTIQRLYFTRGAAEAELYRAISDGEAAPNASLLANDAETAVRKNLADTQAALLDTQAVLTETEDALRAEQQQRIAAQQEVGRLQQALATATPGP